MFELMHWGVRYLPIWISSGMDSYEYVNIVNYVDNGTTQGKYKHQARPMAYTRGGNWELNGLIKIEKFVCYCHFKIHILLLWVEYVYDWYASVEWMNEWLYSCYDMLLCECGMAWYMSRMLDCMANGQDIYSEHLEIIRPWNWSISQL